MIDRKLYLILNESITGIGGSYIYIMNKLNYYKNLGYDVNLIHGGHAVFKTVIPKLEKYVNNKEEEIRLPIHYLSKKKQLMYVDGIIKKYELDSYSDVIIESSTYNQATWGETISSRIGAKHFVLLLTEKPVITDRNAYNFFNFKLSRKELCGIASRSLQYLFDGWRHIEDAECYNLPCYCNNSIDDVDFVYPSNIKSTDYTIGCLGRFDKPYFIPSLIDLKNFINTHQEFTFTIILIGTGKSERTIQQVNEILAECNNTQVVKMGSLFPVPLKLIQKANIFIASAGSCTTIRYAGVNVISYDGRDLKPIGIYSKTTQHSLFRDKDDETYTLDELLDMVLLKKMFLDNNPVADMEKINNIDFSSHKQFVESSEQKKVYYDFNLLGISKIAYFSKILTSIFTPHFIFKSLDYIRKSIKINFSVEQNLAKLKK